MHSRPALFALLFITFLASGCSDSNPPAQPAEPAAEASKAPVSDDPATVAKLTELGAELTKDNLGLIVAVRLKPDSASPDALKLCSGLVELRTLFLDDTSLSDDDFAALSDFKAPLSQLNVRNCKVTDAVIDHIVKVPTLRAIRFSGESGASSLSDEAIGKLSSLKNLKVLALDHLWIGTEGLKALLPVTTIEELYLSNTLIDDSTLEVLAKFPSLRKVRLSQTQISNDGLKFLTACKTLEELDLSQNSLLSDDGLVHVGQITSLKKLNLWRVGVGNAGIAHLAPLTKLEWLNLDNTQLSDDGLTALKDMKALTFLHIGSTSVSDAGLPHLYTITALKDLKASRTSVTEAGVATLKEKLPNTDVQLKYKENL